MTDNLETEDNSLDNKPITEKEKVIDLTEPTKEEEIENITQTQDSENMEVHHHSSHHHGKKTWRTYGWEFGMLFMAVFCGFLAEYFLEHRIEKEKGKEYVESMMADIVLDSVKINKILIICKKQQLGLDSLAKTVLNQPYNDSVIKKMYISHLIHTKNVFTVAFTKRTISQLKNSGGMRLISNKAISDEITAYNESTEEAEFQGNYFANTSVTDLNNYNVKLFDMKYFMNLSRNEYDYFIKPTTKVKLVNDDEKLLKEYGYTVLNSSKILIVYMDMLNTIQKQIPKTLEILKKESD